MLAGAGIVSPAWAQTTLRCIMPGVFMPDAGKPVVESMADVNLELAPYVSPTDTMAKISAPGGTAKYDLMVSLTEFVKGPVLGPGAGDEKALALDLDQDSQLEETDAALSGRDRHPATASRTSSPSTGDTTPSSTTPRRLRRTRRRAGGILFDDKYAGKVALRDDAHQMITVGALFLGHENPNAMTDAERKDVVDFLISKKKNFRTLWSKFGEAVNLMASGRGHRHVRVDRDAREAAEGGASHHQQLARRGSAGLESVGLHSQGLARGPTPPTARSTPCCRVNSVAG